MANAGTRVPQMAMYRVCVTTSPRSETLLHPTTIGRLEDAGYLASIAHRHIRRGRSVQTGRDQRHRRARASRPSVQNLLPQVPTSRFVVERIRGDGHAVPGTVQSAALLLSAAERAGPARVVLGRIGPTSAMAPLEWRPLSVGWEAAFVQHRPRPALPLPHPSLWIFYTRDDRVLSVHVTQARIP